MKKNKIKWYSYMAFILSSPYLLESCASSVDNNNMIRNEANISCSELYQKKQNELTQINEFSDSSLGSESSTKEMKEASGEPNNLIENKEESSSEESDNVFQNSDPYADLTKAVNYNEMQGFIEECIKLREEDEEEEYSLVEYLLQKGIPNGFLSEQKIANIRNCINNILFNKQPDTKVYKNGEKKEENSSLEYEEDQYIALAIKKIYALKQNELFLLRRESYSRLFDILCSNDDKEKKALLEKLNNTPLNCKINSLILEYNSKIVYENESCGSVMEFNIHDKRFKIRICYIGDGSICVVTKLLKF